MRFDTILAVASASIVAFSSGAAAATARVVPVEIHFKSGGRILDLGYQKVDQPASFKVNQQNKAFFIDSNGNPDNRGLANTNYVAKTDLSKMRTVTLLSDGTIPPITDQAAPVGSGQRNRAPRRRVEIQGVTNRLGRNL
ncbi:hypothetical protein MCOR25_008027 [Pyricularia grisea]|uniref:Uncharacterized protein n=1 Tax=Pyricularia grisea TaxID=148305 RepID=A0A6P8AQZ3_PYRGI|nr:uncharacterized protein PgNI_12063 [Pyricularia grisea]KAI6355981.1 hypothetical protein MCOR25_008027 [Pyricularia grisea]TLD04463.1 hypothetical protein PgNI_12063 [Pyricularia grisea]